MLLPNNIEIVLGDFKVWKGGKESKIQTAKMGGVCQTEKPSLKVKESDATRSQLRRKNQITK